MQCLLITKTPSVISLTIQWWRVFITKLQHINRISKTILYRYQSKFGPWTQCNLLLYCCWGARAGGYKEMSYTVTVSLLFNNALEFRVQKRGEGGSCGVSANEYSCAHHVTWGPNKLWRSTSIFNLWAQGFRSCYFEFKILYISWYSIQWLNIILLL